jgi:ribonuclease HII
MANIAPTFEFETAFHNAGLQTVVGIDEAGRGALAGPLVAGCVLLNPVAIPALSALVRDSKLLSANQRVRAFQIVVDASLAVAIGIVGVEEIDELGIGPSNRLALERAVERLPIDPDAILCDAFVIEHSAPQVGLIDGDARCLSISAASIIAKVTRDRMMVEHDSRYRAYGFAKHAGYGTPMHLEALRKHGPCAEHRHSFAPVRDAHFNWRHGEN